MMYANESSPTLQIKQNVRTKLSFALKVSQQHEHIVGREHHVIYALRHRLGIITGVHLKSYSYTHKMLQLSLISVA